MIGKVRQGLLNRVNEMPAGPRVPAAAGCSFLMARNGIIAFKTSEMIDPENIVDLPGMPQPPDPPVEAGSRCLGQL